MLTPQAIHAIEAVHVVLLRKQSREWSAVLQRLRTVLSSGFEN